MHILRFKYGPNSDGSLSTYLPLKFLDSLISDKRLPFKGLGLMILIRLSLVSVPNTAGCDTLEALLVLGRLRARLSVKLAVERFSREVQSNTFVLRPEFIPHRYSRAEIFHLAYLKNIMRLLQDMVPQ